MGRLSIVGIRRRRCAMLACLAALAGCSSPPLQNAVPVPADNAMASPVAVAPLAAPARIDVVNGNVWSDALAAVTRSLQQAALANGEVEVMRTADNRLRLRIDAAAALDRRGDALQPRFRRFAEDMASILAPYPSVRVQVVGYHPAPQAVAARQALGWARSGLRVLATHGVGAERLTARARNAGAAEADVLGAPGRCIEFVLSDPIER